MGAFAGPGFGPGINRPSIGTPSPIAGTGPRPIILFDIQKRKFNLRFGLPIGHRIGTETRNYGILRKHGLGEIRLYSGLKKHEIHRIDSGISLSHGQSRTIARSELTIQKRMKKQGSTEILLSRRAHEKTDGQVSIQKNRTEATDSAGGLSQRRKKRSDAKASLKKRGKTRTEARIEQEDDIALLAGG